MHQLLHVSRTPTTGPGIRTPRKSRTQVYILGARVRFERKLADSWIGVFWQAGEPDHMTWARQHHVWICFVPWFPLHITYWRPLPSLDED